MRYVIKTTYDNKALTELFRVRRKTVNRQKSRKIRMAGWVLLGVALVTLAVRLASGSGFDGYNGLLLLAAAVIVESAIAEDAINGMLASKKLPASMKESTTVFTLDGCVTTNLAAETAWNYQKIKGAYETRDYFIFLFDRKNGQIHDKKGFKKGCGTPDEFRAFMEKRIERRIKFVD